MRISITLLFALIGTVCAGALRDAFNARCSTFLADAASPNGGTGTWADLARLALGSGIVSGAGIRSAMADMAQRKDTSDFCVTGLIRSLTMYGNSSMWPAGLAGDVRTALLGWQYWIDEANGFQGNMEFWTENHQSIFSFSHRWNFPCCF